MRTFPRFVAATVAALALTTLATPAAAQTGRTHLGPRVSYNFDIEEMGIGAQLSLPIARHLDFYPSFDTYLVSNGSLWGLNLDLKYRVEGEESGWLYLGGGLNLSHSNPDGGKSHSDSRANLFVGGQSLRGNIHPFMEFRAMLGNGSAAQISAGLNFTLR